MPTRKLFDISPPITTAIATWPGDTDYQQEPVWVLDHQCPVNVGKITLSAHTGAHADAPLHYSNSGAAIGSVPLEPYLGTCRVIHCFDSDGLVRPAQLLPHLAQAPERILLRTYRHSDPCIWDQHSTAIAVAAIELLARHGVKLVGIDTPRWIRSTPRRWMRITRSSAMAWPFSKGWYWMRCRPATMS